ncbi:MAG: ABC transporter permease [Verrucomicrobia bacterium]|nr:ABC transporter permease [Verrucomicrobiota bacterium]
MSGVFLLARRSIRYHFGRTLLLTACLTLTFSFPASVHLLVARFQQRATARADATPLLIGAKGSRFGLALHALSFQGETPELITMRELEQIRESALAMPVPLLARFRARGHLVVGTTTNYFRFRHLEIQRGRPLGRIGDCLLGAAAAAHLNAGPGDRVVTESENLFNLAGPTPLNLRVAGVLAPAGTEDDSVVFVDLQTAWILEGIGHGHPETNGPINVPPGTNVRPHSASASNLRTHSAVTDENQESFHFHGNEADFPLSAIIALPNDEKSETLLMGRYLTPGNPAQVLKPGDVVQDLMRIVFDTKRFLDLGALLFGAVTFLLVGLIVALSLRLRKQELETMFKLGCSRWTIVQVQSIELLTILAMSLILASFLSILTNLLGLEWVSRFLVA